MGRREPPDTRERPRGPDPGAAGDRHGSREIDNTDREDVVLSQSRQPRAALPRPTHLSECDGAVERDDGPGATAGVGRRAAESDASRCRLPPARRCGRR